jgi:hypothetical protein
VSAKEVSRDEYGGHDYDQDHRECDQSRLSHEAPLQAIRVFFSHANSISVIVQRNRDSGQFGTSSRLVAGQSPGARFQFRQKLETQFGLLSSTEDHFRFRD